MIIFLGSGTLEYNQPDIPKPPSVTISSDIKSPRKQVIGFFISQYPEIVMNKFYYVIIIYTM